MKSNYLVVALILCSFTFSFCMQENKKEAVVKTSAASVAVENSKNKGKCCVSSIPARFSIKKSTIPQPEKKN